MNWQLLYNLKIVRSNLATVKSELEKVEKNLKESISISNYFLCDDALSDLINDTNNQINKLDDKIIKELKNL